MKVIFKKIIIIGVLSIMFSSSFAKKVVNFGVISTESSTNAKVTWEPFIKDISKKLGLKVNLFFATDYAGVVEAMRFGKVDFAWLGNKSAIEAVDRANGEVFAQIVAADGSAGYWAILIANKDSKLNNLKDVLDHRAELTFGNGDPNSTSGFLVPSYYVFALNNVSPSDFKISINAGHQTNLLSVATKKIDVATNNTEDLARLQKTNPKMAEKIKIVWKSPIIPLDPIVWNKNLDSKTKSKIRNFFLSYGKTSKREKKFLASLGWRGFQKSDDNQLLPIRELTIFKKLTKLKEDKSNNSTEKLNKITEYESKLRDLQKKIKSIK